MGQDKNKNISYLTSNDVINRSKGYNTYLPENLVQCIEYWTLSYGMNLASSVSVLTRAGFQNHSSIVDMIQVETSSGSRIVPRCLIFSAISETPSRTRRHAWDITNNFINLLHSASFLLAIQDCHCLNEYQREDNSTSISTRSKMEQKFPLSNRFQSGLALHQHNKRSLYACVSPIISSRINKEGVTDDFPNKKQCLVTTNIQDDNSDDSLSLTTTSDEDELDS
mmetsp:Transcript_34563/g.35237  ORF Transcript_34563/g.35237 Transcript_34563/m.35237 type:complete len:224 (+) Transcript_34563:898-1569(+)